MTKDPDVKDNIVVIESEIDDDISNDDLFNINSWGADLSFRELITMYDENELEKPELQRKYVWDKMEASRFIESILLGLPVPSIFLAKTQDEKSLIVDGYQRIMTIYDYVFGIFSKDDKVFKLSNSKRINERWRNKAFKELSESDQRKIRNKTIHAIIFEQIHPSAGDTSLYQVFERINTSGRTLMPQEIRNCVYQGKLNTLLFELNRTTEWRKMYGDLEEDFRMRDLEMILRFFALSSDDIKNRTAGQISLKTYLNDFMGFKVSENQDFIEEKRVDFIKTVEFIYNSLGENCFRNIDSDDKIINRFHPTIFDSIMIAFNFARKNNFQLVNQNLNEVRLKLLKNNEYINSTTIRTTNIDNIKKRISLALNYFFDRNYE